MDPSNNFLDLWTDLQWFLLYLSLDYDQEILLFVISPLISILLFSIPKKQ